MPKQIVADVLETLGQTVKQTAGQIIQEPGKILETAGKQATATTDPGVEQPQGQANQAQQVKKQQQAKRMLMAFEAELADIRKQQAQELPKQVTGKPGFSEENVVKQLTTKEQGKLPPLPVRIAKQKGGTGERKRGVSG